MNLSDENIINFQEGNIYYNTMEGFGPFWNNNDQLYFHPDRPGAQIGFLLRSTQNYKGDLTITFTTAFDTGKVEILLNNEPLSQEAIDLYTPTINIKKVQFKHVIFEKGNNILSIKVIGQNGFGIDTIEITPIKNE
jgi:hypothetical protein